MKRISALFGIVVLLFLVSALVLFASSAHAGTVTLPFINGNGFQSTFVMLNPTSAAATVSNFWEPTGVGAPPPAVQPHQAFRYDGYPRENGGVFDVDLPDLPVYMEIRNPSGQIVRIPPISAVAAAGGELFDLPTTGDFKTYLFLSTEEGSSVTATYYHDATRLSSEMFILQKGETAIPEVPAGANRAVITYGIGVGAPNLPSGPIYALALISHQPAGELLTVASRDFGQ